MAAPRNLGLQVAIVVALTVLISLAIWLAGPPPREVVAPVQDPRVAPSAAPESGVPGASDEAAAEAARRSKSKQAAAVRAKIRASLAAHPETTPEKRPSAPTGGEAETTAEPKGTLTDRVGLPPELLQALHREFMDLADECVDAAHERLGRDLEGMAALEFSVIADPELGAVVDEVRVPEQATGDGRDEELGQCLSQTALSMLLPEAEALGQTDLAVTLRLEPETR